MAVEDWIAGFDVVFLLILVMWTLLPWFFLFALLGLNSAVRQQAQATRELARSHAAAVKGLGESVEAAGGVVASEPGG